MAIALEIILFNLDETNSAWNFMGDCDHPVTPLNKNVQAERTGERISKTTAGP